MPACHRLFARFLFALLTLLAFVGPVHAQVIFARNTATIEAAGGSGSIEVRSVDPLATWQVRAEHAWLTVASALSGSGNDVISYSIAPNPTAKARTATLTLLPTAGGAQALNVTQAGATLGLSLSLTTGRAAGDTGAFTITTDSPALLWTAVSHSDWLTVTSGVSGVGRGTVNWSISAGGIPPGQTGIITVTPLFGVGKNFAVFGGDDELGNVTVDPSSQIVSAAGQTGLEIRVVIKGNVNWTVTKIGDWITITDNGGGRGPGTIVYNVAPNPTGAERSGSITIIPADRPSRSVPITQLQGTLISVSPSSANVAAGGGSDSVTVTTYSGLQWTIMSSADWLTFSGGSPRTGPASVTWAAASNTGSARDATLTFQPVNGPPNSVRTVQIHQFGPPSSISVNPTTVPAPASVSSGEVTVTTIPGTLAWTATASSGQTWLRITSGSSGTGSNPKIQYAVDGNPTAAQRSATITVAASGVPSATVTVTQAATTTIINPSSATPPGTGGTGQFSFTTNNATLQWTAASSESWLTLTSPASGTGDATMAWAAGASPSASSRTGNITITPTGGGSPLVFTVTQQGLSGTITVDPTSLAFSYRLLSSEQPGNRFIQVTSSPSALAFTATAATTSGGSWLTVSSNAAQTPASLTVSVNTTGLAASDTPYQGTVTITSGFATNSPITINVTLTVTPAPILVPQPSALNFSYQRAGPLPSDQTITVTTSPPDVPLNYTITSNATWLSATGESPGLSTLRVKVTPGDLPVGDYSGKITLTSPSAGNSPEINVTLHVTTAPSLVPNPSPLTLTYTQLDPAPVPLSLRVTSSGTNQSFSASVSSDTSWLNISGISPLGLGSTASGQTPSTVQISIDPRGLAVGTYSGLILLASTATEPGQIFVPVNLTVLAGPSLGAQPAQLNFGLTQGGPTSASLPLVISSGNQLVSFTTGVETDSGGNWLTVSSVQTAIPTATLTVTASANSLAPGTYTGRIVVTSAQATNSPLTVPVTLVISTQPQLIVQPTQLSFQHQLLSGSPPADMFLSVSASNNSQVPITATVATTSGGNWLSTGVGFDTPGSLSVNARPNGLAAGTYHGTVTLMSPGFANATVPVTLSIVNAPILITQPTLLNFSFRQGGTVPTPQLVNVNSSSTALPFSVTSDAPWLIVTGGGTTNSTISVSINPAGLAPNTYTGNVSVISSQAGNSPLFVPVTLLVTAGPVISALPTAFTFTYTENGTVAAAQALSLASGDSLSFSISISPGESWLVLEGEGAARNVSIDPDGLRAGQYTGLITVTAQGAGNSPLILPVTLNVVGAPLLSPSPSQFTFSYQIQGALPANQVLTVSTSDNSPLVVTATAATITGGNWLSLTGGGNAPATFNLTANPSGLAAGAYQGIIKVSAANAGNSPLDIPVTFVVSAAPVISAAPGQLSFSHQVGGPNPATSGFQVTSSGGPLSFQVEATTDSGGPWLQVSGGGTTPLTVTAGVNPAGLAPGIYTGAISLPSAGAGNAPLLVPVTLTVTTTAALSATPASIQFTVQENTPAPPAQVVRVQMGSTQAPVTYSASPNAPWLTFSGGSTTPADLSLSVSPAGLAPGRYTAIVLVKSDFAANSPLEIPVTLDVSATPVLSAVPTILRFAFDRMGPRPPAQTLSIVSSGPAATFNVSVVPGPAWLFASGTGTTPSTTSVSVDPGILTAGEYQGTVLITPTAGGAPVQVQVVLTVSDAPLLSVQPPSRNFVYQINGLVPPGQAVVVTSNRGSFPVTAAVETFNGGGWLAVNGGGNTPATFSATVQPVGLGAGVYKGQIAFSAVGTGNSPITVPVTLTVTSAPAITTTPAALTFASQVNGAPPANQLIVLNSSDGSPLPIGSAVASNGATWLSVNRSSDTTPATLTISISPAGLTAGVYQGSIVISSPSAENSPIILPVVLTVSAQPSLTASTTAVAFASGVGGSAPQPIQVEIGSTGAPLAFSSSVAPGAPWLSVSGSGTTPSPIQVRVNPAGLLAGQYSGVVQVTSAGAANSPLLLAVNLIVSGAPLLSSTQSSLIFSSGPSGSPSPQTLRIASSAPGLSVTASPSPATPWLSVSGGGATPLDLTVSANTAGLAPGTYQGSIQILAPGAGNSPFSIPVTLQISAAPVLQASPSPISFSSQVGDPSPDSQTVMVTLGGQPAIGARAGVAPGSPWLSAEASGSDINVIADPAGLLPGTYLGSVTVTADGAANSPLTVPVTLTIAGFPVFDISQDAVAFAAVRGQSQPISTTITLGSGNSPTNFELDVTASTWLTVTPLTGSTPANLTITVNPTDLRSGNYSGSVIVSSNGNRVRTVLVNLVVADAPALGSSPPFLQFSYLNGGDLPSPVNLWVGRFGTDVAVTATPSEPWLTVDPSAPSTSGPIKVTASPVGLSPGAHQASILLTAVSSSGAPVAIRRVPVTLYVNLPANPRIAGVLNGMSFLDTPLVPGLIFSIFGTGLGPASPSGPAFQPDGTLSQSVAGVEVLINGIPCPLLYVSATQINAIAPYALFNRRSAQVAIRFLGILSDEVPVNVAPAIPGVFSAPQNGAGPGVILNQDLSVNAPGNPATRETIIAIYAGGGGQTTPQGLDGAINGPLPLPNLLLPVSVVIGGIPAPDISYAGAAPGFPDGSLQINVKIPDSVPSGNVPVIVKIGDAISQGGLTVSVR